MDWKLFVSVYVFIFLAELPDKTAFATVMMATRGHPWPVFLGACIAFVVQSLIAVCFGSFFSLFPEAFVHLAAGLSFFVFAFFAFRGNDDDAETTSDLKKANGFWLVAWSSFVVIFIAEWGDLTQLATLSLVAHYQHPFLIFVAATLALWTVTGAAVIIGSHAKRIFHPRWLNRISAVSFVLVGCYFIFDWWRRL